MARLLKIMSFPNKKLAFAAIATVCVIFVISSISSKKPACLYPDDREVFTNTCSDSMSALDIMNYVDHMTPVIYFITPTYARREQVAELTRLSQTLLHINNLVWIIAEDSKSCSSVVSNTLLRHKERIPYVHLTSPMPQRYIHEYLKPKGVSGRNAGVKWILDHEWKLSPGVIYFGDDDNTYDLSLFEEIRWTKKVSMFPVAFTGDDDFSSPVTNNGKVIGFSDHWFEMRKFPVDMAGFAVNTEVLRRHRPKMPYLKGFEETLFLKNMNITIKDIEPLANGCTEILVWHTQTKNSALPIYRTGVRQGQNLEALMVEMSRKGMLKESSNGHKPVKVCMREDGCNTNELWSDIIIGLIWGFFGQREGFLLDLMSLFT